MIGSFGRMIAVCWLPGLVAVAVSVSVESMPTLIGGWTVPFVAAVGLACYLNCVICEFVFDDRFAIVTNKDIYPGAPTRAPC